jgi:hypothetical protein
VQLLGDRIDDRGADTAAHAHGVPALDELGGAAERSGDVLDRLARGKLDKVGRALADGLDDERDRAGLGVGVRDRERDALRARAAPHDDELAGLPDLGDARRLDDQAPHVRGELRGRDDLMHVSDYLRMLHRWWGSDPSTFMHQCAHISRAEGHVSRRDSPQPTGAACFPFGQ